MQTEGMKQSYNNEKDYLSCLQGVLYFVSEVIIVLVMGYASIQNLISEWIKLKMKSKDKKDSRRAYEKSSTFRCIN